MKIQELPAEIAGKATSPVGVLLRAVLGEPWTIEVFLDEMVIARGDGSDQFQALMSVRRQLEEQGLLLLVNGARKDSFATGFARSMAHGTKVYVLRLSTPTRAEDLLDTLSPAELAKVGTVDEQAAHFAEWKSSLGS